MMVNRLNNNNSAPWQSTIPNQMPWLNSSPISTPMQFGQSSYTSGIDCSNSIQATGLLSQPIPAQGANNATLSNQTVSPMSSSLMLSNPFHPQQLIVAQQFNEGTPTSSQQYGSVYPQNLAMISPPSQTGRFESSFLTQLPPTQQGGCTSLRAQPMQQKRTSFEMEDEITEKEAPPTKQQLSESRLFKRFGSLQLDNKPQSVEGDNQEDDLEMDYSDGNKSLIAEDEKDINRYVYLLFKGKNSNETIFNDAQSRAMKQLIKDDEDKKSKAVMIWTPPQRHYFVSSPDSDDDEEISYKDHRDFLKEPLQNDDSIIITEVEDDAEIEDVFPTDDVMRD